MKCVKVRDTIIVYLYIQKAAASTNATAKNILSFRPGLCSFGISGITGNGNPSGGGDTFNSPPFLLGVCA